MAEIFSNYAVAIIVSTPQGVVVVRDSKKPTPHFWKFPGGRNHPGETPPETAQRELQEETGLTLDLNSLTMVHQEARGDAEHLHHFFCFKASLANTPTLPARGLSGEEVCYVPKEKIPAMPDFFPNHKPLLDL